MSTIRKWLAVGLLALPLAGFSAEAININTADAATMAGAIKGVGKSRAEAIVAYREKHGPFASVDDLALVAGIGSKLVDQNRGSLTVGAAGGAAKKAQ
ncbi:MAG: ComEA family DNA-binding protein [Gammaproteobacteria bacterium]